MTDRERSRSVVDPEGRYPSDGFTAVEETALKVWREMAGAVVERTRDVVQLTEPGEHGVVVIVTPESTEFRLPTIEWTMGAYGPTASSRLWRRRRSSSMSARAVRKFLGQARAARAEEFRICKYCGRNVPPEHRIGPDVCHGCASKYEGIVF